MSDPEGSADYKHLALVYLALAGLLALAVWMFVDDNDALAKSRAVGSGQAERVPAELVVRRVKSDDGDITHRVTFDMPAEYHSVVPRRFDAVGSHRTLREWEGADVTVLVHGGEAVAVELPDGTVVRSSTIGWTGLAMRWSLGVFFVGAALLVVGFVLDAGRFATVLGSLLCLSSGAVLLHVWWFWFALVVDALVAAVVLFMLVDRVRGRSRGKARSRGDGDEPPAGPSQSPPSLFDV